MPLTRRSLLTGFSCAAAVSALAACGGGSSDADTTSGVASNAQGGSFPARVTHKYGTTTVQKKPTRIVTVGLVEQDMVLALGTAPVAVTKWIGAAQGAGQRQRYSDRADRGAAA